MKQKYILLFTILQVTNVFSQIISDSVELGNNYINQVYYKLSNGQKNVQSNTSWDLQFPTSLFSAMIRINEANGVKLYNLADHDTANFATTTIDTTGVLTNNLHDKNEAWENSAFNSTSSGQFDYGWGIYNSTTHIVEGNRTFVIKTKTGFFKKIIINSFKNTGEIIFTIANLDGSNLLTRIINRLDYTSKQFIYYNIDNDTVIDFEPIKDDWDFVFRKYYEYVGNNAYYNVTGALLNNDNTCYEARNIDYNDALINWQNNTYDSYTNTIGYDFKELNMSTFQYECLDSLSYFVKTKNSDVYHLIFTKVSLGSQGGKIVFTKQKLGTIGIKDIEGIKINTYPNPVVDIINIEFDNYNNSLVDIYITDVNGRVLDYYKTTESKLIYNISYYEKGLYILNIIKDGKIYSSEKIIKI